MAEAAKSSNLINTINYLLDNVLGLDRTSNVVEVVATPATKNEDGKTYITIEFKFTPGSWAHDILELVPFKIDVDRLTRDRTYVFELQNEIKKQLDPQIADYVSKRTEGLHGVERGIVVAAANALEHLLSSQILQPLSGYLAEGLIKLELPERADIVNVFGSALDTLRADYFEMFVPEIAKTFAKMGLSEILTIATSDSSPEWANAIRSVGEGIFSPIIDNLVTNYFADTPLDEVGVFDNVKFTETFGNAIAGLLIDFQALDKKIIDDILGLDGDNLIEKWVGDLLSDKLNGFVKEGFVDALKFLAGDFDAAQLEKLFADFSTQFHVQDILGSFFLKYASTELADLFIDIDSLPEALLSQLGSTIASGALGHALGTLAEHAVVDLFGQAAASAIGTSIFQGLGTILGAGIGAIAGSVVFELIDDIFDGAISDIFNDIIEWIRNDSPQAFYQTVFDPDTNQFDWSGYAYSKDGSDGLRLAVRSTMEAFEDKINTVIGFVGQPASFDTYYNDIFFVWGKKHYNESYAAFIGSTETMRVSINRSAEVVVKQTIGLVLSHMNFHTGNPIIAAAYDLWKAGVAAGGGSVLAYFGTDALLELQNLMGLARFANDYRQDPTKFDLLMASDAPVAVTLLQQYFEAEMKGFNAQTVLKGSILGFEEIGSAAAGDTIILDGPAWRAVARGGDDTIYTGSAALQEIDGGTGTDTIVLGKDRGAYSATVTDRTSHGVVLIDAASGAHINVTNVERFSFNGAILTFDEAFPNRPPVITSDGGASVGSVSLPENSLVATIIAADDADGDVRTFAIVGGSDAALFRIDAATGALWLLTAPSFLAPRDANRDNVYEVTVAASDGRADDIQTLLVRVTQSTQGLTIVGTSGDDVLTASDLDDVVRGMDGNDTIGGGGGADFVLGGRGNDRIGGGQGNDRLFGGVGDDLVSGGPGDDLVAGEEGDDLLDGGAGNDRLHGGSGRDTVRYTAADSAVTVSLATVTAQNTGGAGIDLLVGVENLIGSRFNDTLTGNGYSNLLDGSVGADTLSGGLGDDVYVVDDPGDIVQESLGEGTDEIRTNLGSYSLAARPNVENLTGTAATGQTLTGNANANVVTGSTGNDWLYLSVGGGKDSVFAGGGDDNIFFGATMTAADSVDGGAGFDTLVVQGNYAGGLTLSNVTAIEAVSLLAGSNTSLGAPGTGRYDYAITTRDANFAPGLQVKINGSALLAGEDFTFDGSAERDGSFVIYGGRGVDLLTGGVGNDIFFFSEGRFAAGDKVNGGDGYDGLFLRGNYTVDFNAVGYAGAGVSIENLTLSSATDERYARGGGSEFDYSITLADSQLAAGAALTVNGALLGANETMVLDGSRETNAFLRLFGGSAADTLKGGGQADTIHGNLGADTLAGGGGSDRFLYNKTAESTAAAMDRILDFRPGTDKIDLGRIDANSAVVGDQAFAWIGSAVFSGVAGQLRAFQQGGIWMLQGDTNGDSVADLVIALTLQGSTPLGAGDFLL